LTLKRQEKTDSSHFFVCNKLTFSLLSLSLLYYGLLSSCTISVHLADNTMMIIMMGYSVLKFLYYQTELLNIQYSDRNE